MTTNLRSLFGAIAIGLLAATAAHAQTDRGTNTPRIDRRDANQERRIEQGEASGALTPREAARLERRNAAQDKAVDKAAADGTVTAHERKALRKSQRRSSHAIYRQKHDAQTVPAK